MLSISATLASAITAWRRRPVFRARIDWARDGNFTGSYDDMTGVVESITIDRAITTDLPDAASFPAGSAAAAAILEVGGNFPNGMDAATALSPYSGVIATRLSGTVDVDLGMVTEAGKEYADQFVGAVREITISAAERSVSVSMLDNRELLRSVPSLPAIVNVEPWGGVGQARSSGLNSQWVLDRIARYNGFFASPAQRTGCKYLTTFHGAAHAELPSAPPINDKPIWVHGLTALGGTVPAGPPAYSAMDGGLLGVVAGPAAPSPHVGGIDFGAAINAGVNLSDGNTLSVEMWVRRVDLSAGPVYLAVLDGGPAASTDLLYIRLSSAGGLQVDMRRSGTQGSLTLGPAGSTYPTTSDYFVGVHLAMTATGATVNVRVNGTTYSGTLAGVDLPTARPDLIRHRLLTTTAEQGTMMIRDVQITSGQAWSAGFFTSTETHTATAILEPGKNYMLGTPKLSQSDGWNAVQEIAKAEAGVVLFDELGRFVFYNRDHMSGGAAVTTVASTRALKALSSSEIVDSVRNRIRVPASPLKLQNTNTYIWQAQETIIIPGGGSVTIPINFPGVVWNVEGIFTLASQSADGEGVAVSNQTVSITYPSNSTALLTVGNPNAFPIFMVANTTAAIAERGNPYIILTGQCIAADTAGFSDGSYLHEIADTASETTYRSQPLDIDPSPWRQTITQAIDLGTHLLARLKDPHPTLEGVEVVADPRVQLADRITVTEPDTLKVAADYWVVGSSIRLDSRGMSQSLTLRAV